VAEVQPLAGRRRLLLDRLDSASLDAPVDIGIYCYATTGC